MSKILITGGAGYIGANICKVLLNSGYEVRVYDDFSNGLKSRVEKMNLEIIRGDILDRVKLIDAMDGIESVIHLAAKKSVEESVQNPLKYYLNNFSGTLNVLAAMSAKNVKRIIFSSTAVVYSSTSKDSLSEDDPKEPLSPYASTKLLSEEILTLALKSEGISSISLRYFNVVGAGGAELGDNARDNLVPKTFNALGSKGVPEIYGEDYQTPDGTCIRDYIHVLDLAEAHLECLGLFENGPIAKIYNVGSGTGYSVKEVMKQIRTSTGIDFNPVSLPRRAGDPERLIANITKIRNEIGWTPKRNLKEMIDSSWAAESFVL
jgi:UDP-glucose 4-epimerase